MSILHRYLLRSYAATFSLCVGVFLFVLLMNYFLRLFNLAVMKGISTVWIFVCFSQLLPHFMSLALPMAFLVSLLLTLGHFSESGEVLAMRASGFSFRDILTPFLIVAAVLSVLLFYVNHKASPDGYHAFRNSFSRASAQVSRLSLEAKAMTQLGEWNMYAEGVSDDGALTGVRLVKRQGSYGRLRISAPRGRTRIEPERGINLELQDGAFVWPNADPDSHTTATFRKTTLFLPFVDYKRVHRDPDMQELSTTRLMERLGHIRAEAGEDPEGLREYEQKRREYTTERALRSAGAAAPFVLFWAACPLGLRLERRSKAIGFAMSLGVLFVFYGLLALGVGLGRRDLFWSSAGPWLPDVVCMAGGLLLWWRQFRK